jgi:hypothetical protein
LNRGYDLLVKLNWSRWHYTGVGKVNKFTLFWGKLYSSYLGPLATYLPYAFKVAASHLGVLAKGQEVKVVSKADSNESALVLEQGIETGSV